jgi:signal transduction histidine kinase
LLHGDQALLRILLANLLSNALKYSPAQNPLVLRVHRNESNATLCNLVVEDQGPGIPADEIGIVFQKYKRGRSAEGKPGAGLGLAVVDRIAKLHAGSVKAQSQPGHGTRLVVCIPFDTR